MELNPYRPMNAPELSSEEIVAIVDDLAVLHTQFDKEWFATRSEHLAHDTYGTTVIRQMREASEVVYDDIEHTADPEKEILPELSGVSRRIYLRALRAARANQASEQRAS